MDENGGGFEGTQEWVPYVKGAAVSGTQGRRVRVWGRAEGAGEQLRLVASDGTELALRLPRDMGPPPPGLLEVVGVVQDRGLLAHHLLPFPAHISADLDAASHHALAHLLATIDDPWNLGEDQN